MKTTVITCVITVDTTIPYSAELLDEKSQSYIENSEGVKEIFETNMINLASETEGFEIDSMTVSFSSPSESRKRRDTEFASTSVETTFTTSGKGSAKWVDTVY